MTGASKIKPDPVALVQIAWRKVGRGDGPYRMLLQNVAGVRSSKDLDQLGFENCMATLENMGFQFRDHPADHFRQIVLARGSFASSRVVWKAQELAALQKYPLAALCRRVSGGRVCRADRLSPQEGAELLEMLKAIVARGARDGHAVKQAAEPSPGLRMTSEASPAAASV